MILPLFRRPMGRPICTCCLMICFVVFVVGCGPAKKRSAQHAEVSGEVTYKGKAVTGGQVIFATEDGFSNSGVIDEKGHYTINAPIGKVNIAVNNTMLNMSGKQKQLASKGAGKAGDEPTPIKGKYVPLPNKFSTPDTSGQSYTVTSDAQTHNIDLKD